MKSSTKLVSALLLGSAGVAFYHYSSGGNSTPPTMSPDGSATDGGIIVTKKTIDWETVLKSALSEQAKFTTLTLALDSMRDQDIEIIVPVVGNVSQARVRVKYHVEYPIGYVLEPGSFAVAQDAQGLVITLHRPELVGKPAVTLKSYEILDSGYLIDEKTALLELQQRIQPQAEARAAGILRRADIIPRSEKKLRDFLTPILAAKGAGPAPQIRFAYR